MPYFLKSLRKAIRDYCLHDGLCNDGWKKWVGLALGTAVFSAGPAIAQSTQMSTVGQSVIQISNRPARQQVSQLDRSALDRPELLQAAMLTDLARFPLFLPSSAGRLTAASDRLSARQISSPSLIWVQDKLGDRYGSDRLVEQWRAYSVPEPASSPLNYVDVIVNQRIWSLLSYFERYSFISQFGAAAESYGYNLRVFHTGDVANFRDATGASSTDFVALRGAYLCPFNPVTLPPTSEAIAAPSCEVLFDSSSRRPWLDSPLR